MVYFKQKLENNLVNFSNNLSKRRLYQVTIRSLMTAFPVVTLGAFIALVDKTIFIPNGFFNQLYHVSRWLPNYVSFSNFFSSLDILINNLVVIWIAFLVAANAAKLKHQNEWLAGMISGTFLWVCNNQSLFTGETKHGTLNLTLNYSGVTLHGIFEAIIIGLFVSWLLGRFVRHQLLAILVFTLIVASIAAVFYANVANGFTEMPSTIFTQLTANWGTNIFLLLVIVLISNLLMIIGISGPLNLADGHNDAIFSVQNLNYALQHHHLENIPYPVNLHAIYDTYAFVGGGGMMLALLIALLLRSHNHRLQYMAKVSFLPTFFNLNSPLLIGMPVLFNPLLVIPLVITPIVACLVAWLFFSLHLMPAAVYPVPLTTPGFLKGFLATGGNWVALLVGILNLGIATGIYLPFVRLNDKYNLTSKVGD
ncbi:PTS transporter subunit EIIC [Loigolactobacillus backii]|uniref:PTS transporter subunit EIIC n=2 Tax=Loigolactobacillus TaxID=2767889 RepID=UPI000C62A60A|nr:PTS transporter subunit EIIC [Loigolactobacillus backii]MDA5388722.1 PTS transporter subunit EIIC [Loigolactobacillus backii]MDA5391190.1 PTS transporter subunit EIIC [Loigolactobacillus backii]PIO84252.1 PTS sugar transporter [Loigolactobacillus backii]